jgi:hypothetical protein
MTPINEAFETLLPEPAGFRTRYRSEPEMIGHYPWTYADVERRRPKYDRPECEYENLYTADQMRQMFNAATERAAKLERQAVQDALRHAGLTLARTEHGLQVMAAITDAQAESAAIRAAGGAKA